MVVEGWSGGRLGRFLVALGNFSDWDRETAESRIERVLLKYSKSAELGQQNVTLG
jgi:hypothetical protein